MENTIFIEKSYIVSSILYFKRKFLGKNFVTIEELNYVSSKLEQDMNNHNINAIILDEIDNYYFDISDVIKVDVIKVNVSNGLSLENLISRYQGYLSLEILLLIWNEKIILNYLYEFKMLDDRKIFDAFENLGIGSR